ncbi:MAG: hypothetical protein WKG32_08755 [Gemmatimonadaceae bacterium]
MRHRARVWVAALAMPAALACRGGEPEPGYRAMTDDLSLRIIAEPSPPHARERTSYRVVVRDKDSGQPIERGEGMIYASNRDQANIGDALLPGAEVGSYYGRLSYLTAGTWAVAIQFRRDSTKPMQKIEWIQEVGGERPGTP